MLASSLHEKWPLLKLLRQMNLPVLAADQKHSPKS
jgi:hypothetical protein